MRFLRKNKTKKTILVISDLHLSAGVLVHGKRNPLEDFHFDKELVDFLEYYSTGEYSDVSVELVINGDFFDFLAVPFVEYFDDEYWSEKAALDKLKLIIEAHAEVIQAMGEFLSTKQHRITYILGNHDAELLFPSAREHLIKCFPEKARENFVFRWGEEDYRPIPKVVIKHGHEYEYAHDYDVQEAIVESDSGEKYFIPPWGSYFVTRVINKFKKERSYVNQVKPIRSFLINGLIYDTLFTLRFIFATCYYFFMVRFLDIFVHGRRSIKVLMDEVLKELELFIDFDILTREFFEEHEDVKVLIVGHTHEPAFRLFGEDKTFINTGTWTKMYNMDFSKKQDGFKLTYAQILVSDQEVQELDLALNMWRGRTPLPYTEFN